MCVYEGKKNIVPVNFVYLGTTPQFPDKKGIQCWVPSYGSIQKKLSGNNFLKLVFKLRCGYHRLVILNN